MTDDEIIKALEHCTGDGEISYCHKCKIYDIDNCEQILCQNALDLINRQQAEIERLQSMCQTLAECRDEALRAGVKAVRNAKSKAIKEFADRLKVEIISDTAYGCDCNQHSGYYDYKIKIGDIPEYIDNFVKEMTEVEK